MDTICDHMIHGHNRCDRYFDQLQICVGQRRWSEAGASLRLFEGSLDRHMRMEEDVLFPIVLESMRHADGPVVMLRLEHRHIHAMLERMSDAVARLAAVDFFLHVETFTLLMQQHQLKEEGMLYPLLDKILVDRRHAVVDALNAFGEPESGAAPS